MLSDGERTFTWDADNRPVSITQGGDVITFGYSGDGARVRKVSPGKTIRYVGAFEDHVTDGAQVKHIFVGNLRVATRVVGPLNPGTYFTHGDHLGSLNVLTNSQGVEVQRLTYLPFGETHTNQGSVDFHQYRYTGQEQDPESGLYFYQARYYNPVLGRFISPDSIVPEPGNPQSLNRYSYVLNNPVTLVDPSGHQFEIFTDLYTSAANFFTSLFSGSPTISMDWATTSQILLETGILPPTSDAGITTGVGDLNLGTRAQAAGSLVLRAGEVATGLWLGATTGWTGAGAIVSVGMVSHAFLGGWADIETLITGEVVSSVPSQILQQSLGISQTTADVFDVGASGVIALGGAAALLPGGAATGAVGSAPVGAIPTATNPRLQGVIEQLFQSGDIIPGGTAGAIRYELDMQGISRHMIKGHERAVQLDRILKQELLNPADRATAERMLNDLLNAMSGR